MAAVKERHSVMFMMPIQFSKVRVIINTIGKLRHGKG